MSQVAQDAVDVIDIVNRSFALADAKDFDGYRELLADEVDVDFGGVNSSGGEHEAAAGTVTGDEMAANARQLLGPVALTQHLIASHVVTISDNVATVAFYEQALHHHPGPAGSVEHN